MFTVHAEQQLPCCTMYVCIADVSGETFSDQGKAD